jgi:hypothetical protein
VSGDATRQRSQHVVSFIARPSKGWHVERRKNRFGYPDLAREIVGVFTSEWSALPLIRWIQTMTKRWNLRRIKAGEHEVSL